MQDLGFTLDEVADALRAHDTGDATCETERWRLEAVITRLDERIAELHRVRTRAAGPPADLGRPDEHDLIAYGPLLSDDGATWLGTAALTRAATPSAARTLLTQDRYAAIEVHL